MDNDKPLRILTWHIHGSYLYYLTQTPCIFYLPYKNSPEEGYGGRTPGFRWGENVVNVPAEHVKDIGFDCILFQSRKNYLRDQYEILSDRQRSLPKIYLEHDPPREAPADTSHVVDDSRILLVHVTHFNRLMWNSNSTPTSVIEHGVIDSGDLYSGYLDRGIVVINGIASRGRRLGLDIFLRVREEIPLDIVGIDSAGVGGLGEVRSQDLPTFIARYRFFFNPIRYTSLGLSVCEAMMAGLPIVGLATTEMPVTVKNGYSGFISTDEDFLVRKMKELLRSPAKARELSKGARETAQRRFDIGRFTYEWLNTFQAAVDHEHARGHISEELSSLIRNN